MTSTDDFTRGRFMLLRAILLRGCAASIRRMNACGGDRSHLVCDMFGAMMPVAHLYENHFDVLLPHDHEAYRRLLDALLDKAREFLPLVEDPDARDFCDHILLRYAPDAPFLK